VRSCFSQVANARDREINQPEVDRAKLVNEGGKIDPRFPLGLPTVNDANYIWINLFCAALSPTGRAGFVMANSTRHSKVLNLQAICCSAA
jgi:N-6 DNA Methylase